MNIKKIWQKAFGVEFQVDSDVLRQFTEWNEPQWKHDGKSQNGYCYLNFIMINKELSLMVPKILYAKALEREKGLIPVILDWGTNPRLTQLYESFGIESINVHGKMAGNIGGIFKSLFIACKCRIMKQSGLKLQELAVDGVEIGRNIYGDILRSSSLSTIREVDNKICFRKMLTLVLFADTVSKLMKQYPPKVCISDDWAYNEGIVLEYANQAKAYIMQINLRRENTLTVAEGVYQRYRHGEMHTQMKQFLDKVGTDIDQTVVDDYLAKRFEGKNCSFRDRVAFQGKRSLTREEWNVSMGLDPDKKNIVIMCHTFSDAVFNSEYTAFRDYYDWTEQTLKLISSMNHVNWIVKPHPARARYNESADSFEDMFAKYQTDNMHLFPDDVSTASLKDVADVLVTVCGTSGVEFPCFGIPVIACGKAMYSDFGFTRTPDTIEEYRDMLLHVDQIHKLNDEQIQKARSVLYAFIKCFDTPLDVWDDMLYKKLHEMEDKNIEPGQENAEMRKYNTGVLQEIMTFTKDHPWEESQYYQRGKNLSSRICQ